MASLLTTMICPLKSTFISLTTAVYRIVVAPTAITKVVARAMPMMHNAVLTFLRNRFRKQNVKSLVVNPYSANFTMKVYISIHALNMLVRVQNLNSG